MSRSNGTARKRKSVVSEAVVIRSLAREIVMQNRARQELDRATLATETLGRLLGWDTPEAINAALGSNQNGLKDACQAVVDEQNEQAAEDAQS